MRDILSRHRPMVTLEVGDDGPDGKSASRELVDWMGARCYRPFEWRDGELRPHVARNRYEYDNLLFVAD